MALLSVEKRKAIFQYLGLGEYTKANIKAFQKKYMLRKSDWDGVYGQNTDNTLRTVYYTKKYTKNFKPEEFRCECGGKYCCGYPSFMKPAMLKHIQAIRDHYDEPIIVTCGLRDKTWNSKLGGSIQNSLHMQGLAVDFFQSGVTDPLAKRKSSIKWIAKQKNHHYTYGNGIYRLTTDKTYSGSVSAPYMGNCLHTDVYDNVTPTYPKYKEPEKPKDETPKEKTYKVIDVSDWQSQIDWKKVKADGVVGAIIRYADGTTLDKRFAENMKNAKAAGLHVGSYIFSRAKTKAEAEKEAERLFNACKKYEPDMPLYIDLEVSSLSKYANTVAQAFLNKMKKLGARGGVYANLNWWNNYLVDTFKNYSSNPFWIAQYNDKMTHSDPSAFGMWQYSSSGKVDGISGKVDMNKCYVAYWENVPKPVTLTNGQRIAEAATKYAYATNTAKASYENGEPKKGYQDAIKKAYPDRSGWGKPARDGASCDVYAGTSIRDAGVDPNFPRGLSPSYLAKSDKFEQVKVTADTIKDGDIIITDKHICIHVGGKIKEASHPHYNEKTKKYEGGFYPKTTDTLKKRLSAKGAKVYRAK